MTWQPLGGQAQAAFAMPGIHLMGVAAGRSGYVVVGKQVSGGRVFATMWSSANLRDWQMGSNGGLDGRLKSSAANAVAATAAGFVAVGSHGNSHAIWTSADGRNWTVSDVPEPAGASTATLRVVAVNGTRVAAAGVRGHQGRRRARRRGLRGRRTALEPARAARARRRRHGDRAHRRR